jgi:hypothetical protein
MTLRYVGEKWTCLIDFQDTGACTRELGLTADMLINGSVYYAVTRKGVHAVPALLSLDYQAKK